MFQQENMYKLKNELKNKKGTSRTEFWIWVIGAELCFMMNDFFETCSPNWLRKI